MSEPKTWLMQQLESVYQAPLEDLLPIMHYGNGMTYRAMADYLAIGEGTVAKYMRVVGRNQRQMAQRLFEIEFEGNSTKLPRRRQLRIRWHEAGRGAA